MTPGTNVNGTSSTWPTSPILSWEWVKNRLPLIISIILVSITHGGAQILAYYLGFFFLFGYEGLQFISFLDLKNDAISEALPFLPIFVAVFAVLCLLSLVTARRHSLQSYAICVGLACLVSVTVKLVTVMPEEANLDSSRTWLVSLWHQMLGSSEGRVVIGSGVISTLALFSVFKNTQTPVGKLVKHSFLSCGLFAALFVLGYHRAVILASEEPSAQVQLAHIRTGSHLILAGSSGILILDPAGSGIKFVPYYTLGSVEFTKQSASLWQKRVIGRLLRWP